MRHFHLLALLPAFAAFSASAATVTVTDLGDAGNGDCTSTCTLRDAIANAASGDTIAFANTLTYPATITLAGQQLLIYKDFTILGPGASLLSISGNQQSRIFEVAANATSTLSSLTLTAGAVIGTDGGVSSAARAADGGAAYGGAILVNAGSTLQIVACVLTGNLAQGGMGGISFAPNSTQGSGGSAYGGAIYSAGTLSMKDTRILGSSAIGGSVGFAPPTPDQIPGNGGSGAGGAIHATGLTEITDSQLLDSSAQGGRGGDNFFGSGAGGNGGSAQGGALSLSGFTALSFVSAMGSIVAPGVGGLGGSSGSAGVAAGTDLYSTATVLSRSSVLTSTSPGVANTCSVATMSTQGTNFDADSSCPNFTLHGDAKLQIVTSGGATFAFPLWGSPLIDAATNCNDAFGVLQIEDVRGVTRPLDGNGDGVAACDLGAVESDELFANGFD